MPTTQKTVTLRKTVAGSELYAKVAEYDSDGNKICNTYAKKTDTVKFGTGYIESMRFQLMGGKFEFMTSSSSNNTTEGFAGTWSSGECEVNFTPTGEPVYEISFDISVQVKNTHASVNTYWLNLNKIIVSEASDDGERVLINSYPITVDDTNVGYYSVSSRCFVKFTQADEFHDKYVLEFQPEYNGFDAYYEEWTINNVIIKQIA